MVCNGKGVATRPKRFPHRRQGLAPPELLSELAGQVALILYLHIKVVKASPSAVTIAEEAYADAFPMAIVHWE